jgi:gliding motility-associated lipoprotein GldJ
MGINKNFLKSVAIISGSILTITSCSYERSAVTGWDYNNPDNGGFQKVPYEEQETGPNLVLIEGGTFTMGRVEQDVTYDWSNIPRRVTVSSYYMDETEVSNFHYCEYLYWVDRTYTDFPMVYKKALPDTLCWRRKLAYNEPYTEYYLRHPSYRDYPVVGVNWLQASDFCAWRTDRVNEYILIREGILLWNPNQQNQPFNTDAYFAGKYKEGFNPKGQIPDLDPAKGDPNAKKGKGLGVRDVRMSDGILLPRYRLPTEAEWEYAAYGLIGNSYDERIVERRIYPWNGHWVRNPDDKWQGAMQANFVRGKGDYMGVAGKLNDNADITAPVYSYWPNDYGLYNMGGNVSEWVMDVYRPLSPTDVEEFRPFRGNVFKTKTLTSTGEIDEKYDEVMYDIYGIDAYLKEFRFTRTLDLQPDMSAFTENTRKGRGNDSIELLLMDEIQVFVDEAKELLKDKQKVEASRKIREIFDNLFEDFDMRIQQDPRYAEYNLEISPMLRKGMSEYIIATAGNLKYREVVAEENLNRRNYRDADNIDYLDGDVKSSIYYDSEEFLEKIGNNPNDEDLAMYQHRYDPSKAAVGDRQTLINDQSRVYKGGSWRDRAYYMNPGTRRYLDERLAQDNIGFRCAMDRVGSTTGIGKKNKRK